MWLFSDICLRHVKGDVFSDVAMTKADSAQLKRAEK